MSYRSTIARQPEALADTYAAARDQLAGMDLAPMNQPIIGITGIGASFAAAVVGAGELQAQGRRAFAIRACDMADGRNLVDALVGLSHRGRSVETVLAHQKLSTAKRLAITSDPQSPLAQTSDFHLTLNNGSDATPSSTGYTATLLAMGMAFDKLAGGGSDTFANIPNLSRQLLTTSAAKMERLGRLFSQRRAIDCVGSGSSLGTADGASLLIREAARIPASAYDTRHYLHGPLEAMDATTGVVIIGDGREIELAHQVEKIGCPVFLITSNLGVRDGELLTVISVPRQANLIAQGIVNIFAAQLLAAELSDAAGLTDTKFRYRMSDTKVPVEQS
jgi:glucosamine--fructose-6-phosphate aminotransferase (isomerizing)